MPADRNARTGNTSAPHGLRAAMSASYAPALTSIKTVVGLIDREASIEDARGEVVSYHLAWQSLPVTSTATAMPWPFTSGRTLRPLRRRAASL
jgi:hypothetical protein